MKYITDHNDRMTAMMEIAEDDFDTGATTEEELRQWVNKNVTFYYDCGSIEDVAEQVAVSTGILSEIPEQYQRYFDYSKFAEDMQERVQFIELGRRTWAEVRG